MSKQGKKEEKAGETRRLQFTRAPEQNLELCLNFPFFIFFFRELQYARAPEQNLGLCLNLP